MISTDPKSGDLDLKDEIQIMLAEYNTLRTEVMGRTAIVTQVFVGAGLATAGLITLMITVSEVLGLVLFLLLVGSVYFALKFVEHDVLAAATQLRAIEAAINCRAGKRLLSWETDHGLYVIGYDARFRFALVPIRALIRKLRGESDDGARKQA